MHLAVIVQLATTRRSDLTDSQIWHAKCNGARSSINGSLHRKPPNTQHNETRENKRQTAKSKGQAASDETAITLKDDLDLIASLEVPELELLSGDDLAGSRLFQDRPIEGGGRGASLDPSIPGVVIFAGKEAPAAR